MHFNIELLKLFVIFCLTKMVNKCVAFCCSSEYHTNREKVLMFSFPLGKSDLLEKWVKFVYRDDWFPTKNSVFCIKHFNEKFIWKRKQNKLNWDLHSIPTIHSEKVRKPSLLPIPTELRKPWKLRRIIHQSDEFQDFPSVVTQ